MADREANVKKREREVEHLDQERAQWQYAEKKKRFNLELKVMTRLEKEGYYISESGKKVIATQAGLAEEVRARDAVMKTQNEEAETLREKGVKSDQEKSQYKIKLKEEREKTASLLVHASSLEVALKARHQEGVRVGRLADSELAKAVLATEAVSCLQKVSARDKDALARFRHARKMAMQSRRREDRSREAAAEKKYPLYSTPCVVHAGLCVCLTYFLPSVVLLRLTALEKAQARVAWLEDHVNFLELRCESFEERETTSCGLVRELTETVNILQLKMKHTPPAIHFGEPSEEWEYDVAEIAYQLFSKRMNASMVPPHAPS